KKIDRPGIRKQFTHVIDIAPTIADLAGVKFLDEIDGIRQMPFDGKSMAGTIQSSAAPAPRERQYFSVNNHYGIFDHDWMAVTQPVRMPWRFGRSHVRPEDREWELYDLRSDFSQSRDLSESRPEKLTELKELFWSVVSAQGALPVDPPAGAGPKGNPLAA